MAMMLLPPLVLDLGATSGAAVAGCTPADVRRIGSWFRLVLAAEMTFILEGVAEIAAEAGPRAVRARLRSMLPPSEAQRVAA
jgi:hypothetical protein